MIKLFYSNTVDSCTEAILSSLKDKEQGRFSVVIAPDAFLFSIENQVARLGYSLDVEVMSFTRLARSLLRTKIKRCLTPEGCNMIMTRALKECKNDLVYYKKSLSRKGFVNEMYSTITALRNSGISATDLSDALHSMSGYVKNKTQDLITIYNTYLKTLSQNYSDPTTRLESLVKEIPNSEFVRETSFYFVDFYTFNYQEYRVVEKLMQYAYDVNIGVIGCVGGLEAKSIYPTETTEKIVEFAKKSGNRVERVNCYTAFDEFERFIANDLFGVSSPENVKADMPVELIASASPYTEAREVSRKIAELVRKGVRYKNIAVVNGNPDDKTLETCFKEYAIPYFVDSKVSLIEEPSVKYLLLAIDCVCSSYEKSKIMSFVKNPLTLVDAEEGMLFENYIDKYAINYSRFSSPFTLGKPEEIEIPEKVRQSVMGQLFELPKKATCEEYANILKNQLKTVDYQTRITVFFNRQIEESDFLSVKRTAQIPTKLIEGINLLGEVLFDYELTAEDFSDVLKDGLESIKISVVPLSADSVQIGVARDCKYEDAEYLFVVGATDGKIPLESGQGTILTNKYHSDLQSFNMVVRPVVKEENRFGKFCFAEILLKAKKGLYVSYPKCSLSGDVNTKSEIFAKLSLISGVVEASKFSGEEYSEYVTEKQCLDAVSTVLGKVGILDEFYSGVFSLLSKTDKDKIYNLFYNRDCGLDDGTLFYDASNSTSVSKLEGFNVCPYQFFIKNGLRARKRELPDMQSNETGTFIHSVLERFFDENKDRLLSIDFDYAKILAYEIADEILSEDDRLKGLLSASERKINNLKSDAAIITANLNELSKQGKFIPFKTEVQFGFGNSDRSYPPIELASGVKVRGKIDRIDKYENNIIVIDYKTGKTASDLKDIFYGKKIQLYVYLYALSGLGYRPVGAVYQHIDSKFTKDSESKYAYTGQIVNTPEVISMFDRDFEKTGVSRVLPIRIKNGKITTNSGIVASRTLIDEDSLQDVINYAKGLADKADKFIKSGYIEPKPFEGVCENCDARNACPLKEGFRKMSVIKTEEFSTNKDETVDNRTD